MTENQPNPHLSTPAELKERIAAERAGTPFLYFRDDAGAQRIVPLTGEQLVVGRAPEADLVIDWDAAVSSVHAELRRMAGHWLVLDEGLSRNGSFVNGERVTGRLRLRDGDELRLGRTVLVFKQPAGRAFQSTAMAGRVPAAPELTPAQRRVLVALCRPFADGAEFARPATNQQIADELVLTVAAVKTHLRSLFGRFGVEDLPHNEKRAVLVRRAFGTEAVRQEDLRSAGAPSQGPP